MKQNPSISVVLSTYNDERFIKETIESVLSQTFDDFEFIIWNDGSTDSTEEIILSFRDDRIRYYYHENTGVGQALALALKKVKGKYVARIDGDDICMPYRFEREYHYLETHPETVLVSSSVIYINEEGEIIGRSYPWTWDYNIKKQMNIVQPAAMFRREVYEQTCGYQDIKAAEDRVLWSKMACYGKYAILTCPMIKYRWRSNSLSHVIDDNPYATILEVIRKKMCDDETISPADIGFHNQFYLLSKRTGANKVLYYKQTLEEKMAKILRPIIGEANAVRVITLLKNIYAFIKF